MLSWCFIANHGNLFASVYSNITRFFLTEKQVNVVTCGSTLIQYDAFHYSFIDFLCDGN